MIDPTRLVESLAEAVFLLGFVAAFAWLLWCLARLLLLAAVYFQGASS